MQLRSFFLFAGKVLKSCKDAGSGPIVTGQDSSKCAVKRLMSTMWIGEEALAALLVDSYSWRIHEAVWCMFIIVR